MKSHGHSGESRGWSFRFRRHPRMFRGHNPKFRGKYPTFAGHPPKLRGEDPEFRRGQWNILWKTGGPTVIDRVKRSLPPL